MEEAHDLLHLLAQGRLGIGLQPAQRPLSLCRRAGRQEPGRAFRNHVWTKLYTTAILLPQEYDDKTLNPIVAHLTVRQKMTFYFTKAQVPELAGFTKAQRRVVCRGAHGYLYQAQPSARWTGVIFVWVAIGGGAVAIAMASWVAFNQSLGIKLLIGMVGAYVCTCVLKHFYLARLRPYLRRYIEAHQDEIAKSA
jgi:hypothetical protein